MRKWMKMIVFLSFVLLAGTGCGVKRGTPLPVQPEPSSVAVPSASVTPAVVGNSTISFAKTGEGVFIKTESVFSVDNVLPSALLSSNSSTRQIVHVYGPDDDISHEPIETTNPKILSEKNWMVLLEQPIFFTGDFPFLLVSDRLFSFKPIPGGKNFLFVVEWNRVKRDPTGRNADMKTQLERILYLYDAEAGRAERLSTFSHSEEMQYSYPKIDSLTANGRFVSFQMYGCWNCGGHEPETLVMDIQNPGMAKNLGKTTSFSWKGNTGAYEYKELIQEDCPPTSINMGFCYKDLNTVPLKTGAF